MISTSPFGSTGHQSSQIIFGAAALAFMGQEKADATIELMRSHGVNHFDTAASYGESELRLQPWLSGHRSEVFLASKTGDRDGAGARASLERSLERLGIEQLDLIQLHNLVEEDEWRTVHGPGGALEALVKARDEGLVRFIGVTGHGTRIAGMHLRSLAEFDYSSVLLPYNHSMMTIPSYRADTEELMALCSKRNVAVQTIKAIAKGRWPDDYSGRKFSWYEALGDSEALERSVRYVLSKPGLFLNTTSDATKLDQILTTAQEIVIVPSDEEMTADASRLSITPLFDGAELETI